ncbi:hypothetical protein LJR220_004624 [Bradyrhizobium sp. LjRoot220]|uniref:hypothetical protein n=1 Tax=Bradyrhizobium sp. LjRoot220 TaxID=3342284 RepID=UPI003ECC41F0
MNVVFFPKKPIHLWNAVRELKAHARAAIDADDETLVTISEADCGDSICGGARTIVLIMHPRRPAEAVTIDKPLEQITRTDLSDALAALGCSNRPEELPFARPEIIRAESGRDPRRFSV